jgi:hypothetical protein
MMEVRLQSRRKSVTPTGACHSEAILPHKSHNVLTREVVVRSDVGTLCIDLIDGHRIFLPVDQIFDWYLVNDLILTVVDNHRLQLLA